VTAVVEVRTGARLHFGLFGTTPGDGPFGGIGMMIDRPGFVVEASLAPRDRISAPPGVAERVAEIVARARFGLSRPEARHQVDDPSLPIAVRVSEVIPAHRGFGSGTQLSYAVAAAVTAALGVWPAVDLDENLGRGGRSAVGTLGFREGGFLVDAGVRRREKLEGGTARRDVPASWRFVIVDPSGGPGPSGKAEAAGFQSLPPMPRRMPEILFGIVTASILPALDARDFSGFADGISQFNRLVGEHFAPAQGGTFSHPLVRELAEVLRQSHWKCVAQSSWGPAAAVFCESEESAGALMAFLEGRISGEADLFVAGPLNRGASVEVVGGM